MATQIEFGSGFHKRNPDVLTCIANLSNDEVFTPPSFANQMLDTLAQGWAESNGGENIWTRSDITFLDPFTKSGVFLREITKRLTEGLADEIPDLATRVDHILTKQVFGIGITNLTALLARRSVYCAREATSKHSIAPSFTNPEGNIWFEPTQHTWVGGSKKVETADQDGNPIEKIINGRCKYCGASQESLGREDGLETHAYKFIHTDDIKSTIEEVFGQPMQFDVIIGNPPYQLNVGNEGTTSATAVAIYHEFVKSALSLNPRFVSLVIPSRWMTRSTKGVPDQWIDGMISDTRIRVLRDFLDSSTVFPGVDIKGGVCYFLWDRDSEGPCEYVLSASGDNQKTLTNVDYLNARGMGIVLRDIQAISVIEKLESVEGKWYQEPSKNFSSLVSPKDFFTNKKSLTTSWSHFEADKSASHQIKYYVNKSLSSSGYGYVKLSDIPKNVEVEKFHKVYIPASGWGTAMDGDDPVLGKPFVGEPHSVCSQTYLVIGYEQTHAKLTSVQCENIVSYIQTKFFRYLVSLKKFTQQASRGVYQFVPIQDFDEIWTDKKLYAKYGLAPSEIEMIEKKIRPMGLDDEQ